MPREKMKVFLTGGTGFVGGHVLNALAQTPHETIALRRPESLPCIPLTREPVWLQKPLDQIEAPDLAGVDVLVHLASVGVSPKKSTWEEMLYWNVSALVRLMEAAHAAGVSRIVVAGSFSEYGSSADHYAFIPTDAPLLPTNPYAASKAAGFIAARCCAVEKGLELCYLRIFSAYGEGQFAGNFWPALRDAALSGKDFPMTAGEQIRDYIPVEAVAAEIVRAIVRDDVAPGDPLVLNVASGNPVSMRQFAETWWKQWEATGALLPGAFPYRANEPMRFVPQVEKR